MPYRNGRVVGWKFRINEWTELMNREDMSVAFKLISLADVLDKHRQFEDEDFSERLRDAANLDEVWDQEEEGDEVLSEVYDFADEKLIWMGGT